MSITDSTPKATYCQTALDFWNSHDFFNADTVVLGLDIGIEGIGITIRKGQEWIYSKSLIVDLPEAEALATRRAFRASRHARKNRKKRMRRLKELFEKHGLPWVSDEVMSRTDPFKLRYRAITGKLASKEALSICIRSCVLRRGYDYFAMNDDDSAQASAVSQEMPWGASMALTDAKKWVSSAYVDAEMLNFLTGITPLLTHNNKELDEKKSTEWLELLQARHAVAEQEGIPAMLEQYAKNHLNIRKARGKNYPRAHVADHLKTIIHRHSELIERADAFEDALFLPCSTWDEKQRAIFHYNRKTPKEATRHFHKKVKDCPYCTWLEIPQEKCGLTGEADIRLWKLLDFVSTRTFDVQAGKLPSYRAKLPEAAIKVLAEGITAGVNKWNEVKKRMDNAIKELNLCLAETDWNNTQSEQLKDIVTPAATARHGRARMSASAAKVMVQAATNNGTCYAPDSIEQWKQDSGLYLHRAEIDATGGIYPQVRTLLGTIRKKGNQKDSPFATTGFLQRLFASDEIQEKLKGKLTPDYCIVECVKNASLNTKQAKEIQDKQKKNRASREKLAKQYGCTNCSNADFLRMRLFDEQGGSPKTPATCPFTGAKLHPSDLFSAKLQLAHIYPDSRGGLYMSDNLVLTTAEVNHAMSNRTPYEAAHDSLLGWLSWEEMLRQTQNFKWSDKKKELFSFIPTEATSFPDFNNITRTAQLARELKRMVSVWMGITADVEALRTRIGNPCGVYTAAARRSFLWQDYVKDRSDNRHHRIDAAVMTCLPPTGLNDAQYMGIFQTELIGTKRTLMCLQGLNTPNFEMLKHDGNESPIIKLRKRSKYKSLGDSSFWGMFDNGLTHQRHLLQPNEIESANELRKILKRMGIHDSNIPSEKQLTTWLINAQAATKSELPTTTIHLKLNNGTPIKSIWKFGEKQKGKGNLINSPVGWTGVVTEAHRFHQLKKIHDVNSGLAIYLGWNHKKNKWEYYKKIILAPATLAGLRRLNLSLSENPDSPYLKQLLARKKKKSLKELIYKAIPQGSIQIGKFRKGDVVLYDFETNNTNSRTSSCVANPELLPIRTWGEVCSIISAPGIEIKCLTNKDKKKPQIKDVKTLALLLGLSESPDAEAQKRNLHPPV